MQGRMYTELNMIDRTSPILQSFEKHTCRVLTERSPAARLLEVRA